LESGVTSRAAWWPHDLSDGQQLSPPPAGPGGHPDGARCRDRRSRAPPWRARHTFQDAKHVFGVGQARNRVQLAVERTAPFGFLTMTLTILWYALCGHHPDVVAEHRARAPWYLTKANPSVADMLAKLRRTIIAAQYQPRHAGAPHTTRNHRRPASLGSRRSLKRRKPSGYTQQAKQRPDPQQH
jgi:hypothetical protein